MRSSIFSDLHVFPEATNNTEIYMASVQTPSLREGNWIYEVAEIAAALLPLQTPYSVEKFEQSQSSASCHGKIWEHRICNELRHYFDFWLLYQLSVKWISPSKGCASPDKKNLNFAFPYADRLIYSFPLFCGQTTLVLFLTKKTTPLIHNLIHSLNWLQLALLYANKCPEAFYSQICGSLHYQQFGN